jgi:LAO/AO transport system kinase
METVGVGQSEIEVAQAADTTLVLVAPGMGDGIQAAKAGILEVGDVLVVNKADREGADRTVRDLQGMLAMAVRPPTAWTPPIVRTVATSNRGIDDLLTAIDEHGEWLVESGAGHLRRVRRARAEIEALALTLLRKRLDQAGAGTALDRSAEEVSAGRLDAFTAAGRVVDSI